MSKRLGSILALAAFIVGGNLEPAAAGPVTGGVDTSGVTITIVRWQGSDGVHATGVDGGSDPTGCDWAVAPAPLGALPPSDIPPFRDDSYLGLLTCDGVGVEVLWVGPHNTVDLEREARRRVEEYIAHVPVPRLALHANPWPAGLVGLESWFWATGYDGRPIVDRIDALGIGVDVRIDPTAVHWAFGDGVTVDGGWGEAYPTRSTIRHGYPTHGPYTVEARFELVPRYRIDGTEWIELPTIAVSASLSYRAQEAQAVVTG